MVTAYVLIQTEVGKAARVTSEIVDITGVQQAQAVTGPYDVIVRAEARNLDELGKLGGRAGTGGRRHHQDPHLPDRPSRVGRAHRGAQIGGIRGSTVHAPTPRGGGAGQWSPPGRPPRRRPSSPTGAGA